MLRFLLGVLVVCAGVATYTLMRPWDAFGPNRPVWWLLAMLVALPVGTAWASAEAMDRLSPRRAFDRRVMLAWGGSGLMAAGLLAGALAYIIATLMLAVVSWLPDIGVMIVSTACTSVVVLLVCFGRKRAGACVRCLYELQAGQNRCPECGGVGVRG